MARTIAEVITNCRYMLQDEDADNYRYADGRLYATMNAVFGEVWRLRQDLFLASDFTLKSYLVSDAGDAFPIDNSYFQAVVNLIVGYVQLENDAITPDGKAMTLVSMARAMFQGGA